LANFVRKIWIKFGQIKIKTLSFIDQMSDVNQAWNFLEIQTISSIIYFSLFLPNKYNAFGRKLK